MKPATRPSHTSLALFPDPLRHGPWKVSRILMTALLAMAGLVAWTCASSDDTVGQAKTVVGKIQVIGNEPFTSLALETPAGTMYVLHCDADLQKMLLQRQGQSVKIHFKEFEKVPSGQALRVLSAELLTQ